MTCREFRSDLMEWARGAEPSAAARVHAMGCAGCAQFLEEQQSLTQALRGAAMVDIPPAPRFEVRLAPGRAKRWIPAAFAGVALAAAACLTLFVATPQQTAPPVVEETQFVPLPYTVPLSPEERTTVVRMNIPVAALISAGFRMAAADPSATVQADVLVSEDGRARAIRPIGFVNSD